MSMSGARYRAEPVKVHGMGLRLSDEIGPDMYNYGQFQVFFDDGSVGWYEAGWGPMMSETAFFVKDVVSPAGSVSIVEDDKGASADVDGHTRVGGFWSIARKETGASICRVNPAIRNFATPSRLSCFVRFRKTSISTGTCWMPSGRWQFALPPTRASAPVTQSC